VTARHEDALVFALRLAETAPANGGWSAAEVVDAARTFAAYLGGETHLHFHAPVVGPGAGRWLADELDARTGLCDHCDKPQTGGAGGGGLPPEHWCDDHRPDEIGGPLYPEDADASEPAEPEQPSSVGPKRLPYTIATAYRGWMDNQADVRGYEFAIADAVRERLAQYPAETPASQVFADWFGGAA